VRAPSESVLSRLSWSKPVDPRGLAPPSLMAVSATGLTLHSLAMFRAASVAARSVAASGSRKVSGRETKSRKGVDSGGPER
jgi:hypothetical protein